MNSEDTAEVDENTQLLKEDNYISRSCKIQHEMAGRCLDIFTMITLMQQW